MCQLVTWYLEKRTNGPAHTYSLSLSFIQCTTKALHIPSGLSCRHVNSTVEGKGLLFTLVLFVVQCIDEHTSSREPFWHCIQWVSFCVLVLSEQDSAAAQQYSRQGCPTGLRAQLWALILNATNEPEVMHISYYRFQLMVNHLSKLTKPQRVP